MSNIFLATDETRIEHRFSGRDFYFLNLCFICVQSVANNPIA
jgi:hypothetical protein